MEKKVVAVVLVFLLAGTATTLLTKLSNKQVSVGVDGDAHMFEHPFLQCWGLSLGEATCIIIFLVYDAIKKQSGTLDDSKKDEDHKFNPLLFIPPAILHLTCRIFTFIGLLLTSASSFQMLSSCNLVFTSILSKIFLKKTLPWYKWFAIFIVTSGVVIVGVGDLLMEEKEGSASSESNPVAGDIFIVVGMLFYAGQMTYEEKFVKKFKIKPMKAVGLEGSFALVILTIILVVFYFIPPQFGILKGERMENALDGFVQLSNNPTLMVSFICTTLALCICLVAGITITLKLSAVHRIVIDSGRAIIIWALSLAIGWQKFIWLQILGFLVMCVGVLIFNDILIGPGVRKLLKASGYKSSSYSASSSSKTTALDGKDNPTFVEMEDERL
jgi:drug/metabolite transporter (DMT)-like permease